MTLDRQIREAISLLDEICDRFYDGEYKSCKECPLRNVLGRCALSPVREALCDASNAIGD